MKKRNLLSNKGFSAKVFIACIAVLILTTIIYISATYYFTFAHKKECEKNISKLLSVVAELNLKESMNFSLLPPELKEKVEDACGGKIPQCPDHGSYILDSTGAIYCSVHNPDAEIIIETHENNGVVPKPKPQKTVAKKPPKKPAKKTPKDELYFRKALQEAQNNNNAKAITLVKQAIELNSKKTEYHMLLANMYFKEKNYARAKEIFMDIIKKEPQNFKAVTMVNKVNNIIYFNRIFKNSYFKDHKLFYVENGPVEKSSSIKYFDLYTQSHKTVIEDLTDPVFNIFKHKKKLLYSHSGKLYMSNIDRNTSSVVLDNLEFNTTQPIIAPNEKFFAFCSYRGYNKQLLCIYNIADNELNLFTDAPTSITSPAWSPDSRHIVYSTIADAKSEIFMVDNRGVDNVQLTENATLDETPHWADGRDKIVFSSKNTAPSQNGQFHRDIFIMSSDGSDIQNITRSNEVNEMMPKWSPKCSYISFIAITEKNLELCVYNVKTKRIKAVTSFGDTYQMGFMFFSDVAWFPDERMVTFSYGTESNKDIYIVDVESGNYMGITDTHHLNEVCPVIYTPAPKQGMRTFKLLN